MNPNLPKTGEDAAKIKTFLMKKLHPLKPQLIKRAEEIAQELRDKTGITVLVDKEIHEDFHIATEYDRNMAHARDERSVAWN